jgi:hypothetical protein
MSEEDIMADSLIGLLQDNMLQDHGVVDIRAVIKELEARNRSPVAEFTNLFHDPAASTWHFYAMVGMRSLAFYRRLKQDDAYTLLVMTDKLASQVGVDEYYKTISALAVSSETAPVLVDFVQQRLDRRDIPDWRWLAFFAAGTLVKERTAQIPLHVAQRLIPEAAAEPEPQRRGQLEEIAQAIASGL